MNGTTWIVLIGSILLSLLFSIAHYTLRNPSRVRLEHAFSGRRRRRWLKRLDRQAEELLLVTALVRMVTSLLILLAILHGKGVRSWGGDLSALALASGLVAVFGIGLPHAWAKYAGEQTLVLICPVLAATRLLLWPIWRALQMMDLPVRRLSGHAEQANGRTSEVEQEILQLATEGQAGGELDADEMEMITSVIEFHDSRVSEIMTPRTDIEALPVEATREQCVQLILALGHSRIPFYEDTLDGVVGVLYAKDLLAVVAEPFELATTMRRPFYVPETKAISDLLEEFRAQKVHIAIVLDEYGGTAGLITIEDLVEEIVGEIADEYEEPEPEMLARIDDRTLEVDARMYIDDLNDELPIDLPEEEDYDTVGGFVFSTLGVIPAAGERFEYEGVEFTVVEAEERRINRIRITQPASPPGEGEPG